jgi:molybdenum-dependent DNA-binding transcriptional regulator ModE
VPDALDFQESIGIAAKEARLRYRFIQRLVHALERVAL